MMYYYGESYILPLSHDESVHGKATVLGKMNGEYEAKFPQARAMYMYMYMHPGAKLNFMGRRARYASRMERGSRDGLGYPALSAA